MCGFYGILHILFYKKNCAICLEAVELSKAHCSVAANFENPYFFVRAQVCSRHGFYLDEKVNIPTLFRTVPFLVATDNFPAKMAPKGTIF